MITIDGTRGEGGGQVLRSSLALSLATGEPFRIDAIRGQRRKPGLLRQHLTCVRAAEAISGAEVEGAALGSDMLVFRPGAVVPGEHAFSVGTAGSTLLVLQTILVPLALAGGTSTVRVQGGTHNSMAPPFEFLRDTFLPEMAKLGLRVEVELVRHGFYPAGGGEVCLRVGPAEKARAYELLERGAEREHDAEILSSRLAPRVAQSERELLAEELGWSADRITALDVTDSPGPGNVITARLAFEHVTEVVTAFGEKALPARRVVQKLAQGVRRYLGRSAPVGPYLADQLLVPLALLRGGRYLATTTTEHTRTNVDTVAAFLGDVCALEETKDGARIDVTGSL